MKNLFLPFFASLLNLFSLSFVANMFCRILLFVVLGIVTFLLGIGGKLELLSFAVNFLILLLFYVSAEITEHDSVISVIDLSACFVRLMTSVESACVVISDS